MKERYRTAGIEARHGWATAAEGMRSRRLKGPITFAALVAASALIALCASDASAQAAGDGVVRNAYAGVATAMAVQVPGSYVPGKTVVRVGSAVFRGESALGVSLRRTSENNAWSLTGGIGMSRAGVAASVGAEWVFN